MDSMMNRLNEETSPYLLQHATNPVDWYPWGEEAFARARLEDKPIFLSVGYSSCHWCHVMAHESFEHEPTARQLNANFINIKVDREERPDVDALYMSAVQIITRSGGWPMTVFLLPDGRPFHAGTYFPLEPRYGIPSFRQVLSGIAQIYRERRDEVESIAGRLTEALNHTNMRPLDLENREESAALPERILEEAIHKISVEYDEQNGGFGGAPKFPQPMSLEFLLRAHVSSGDDRPLTMVRHSLKQMARGGIYDQLAGGFARYSVDSGWLVPHFEKMLYDNALLSRLYLYAWQITGDEFFRTIACETYDYVLREMTSPQGGFYSATDADSEGVEGKFYTWEKSELLEILGDEASLACSYWGVTDSGNFEGKNILHRPQPEDELAEEWGISLSELRARVASAKSQLYESRQKRVRPLLDDKIITSWNGLMLASLAEAARILRVRAYREAAENAGAFLLREMRLEDGSLLRTHREDQSKIKAFLEDYACSIDGLLEVYQLTYDESWFSAARELADYALTHFSSDEGGFYDSGDQNEVLIARIRNLQDGSFPSANAHFARQLLRLASYTGEQGYEKAALSCLRAAESGMSQFPQAFAGSLTALESLHTGIVEVAIIGDQDDASAQNLLNALDDNYRPNIIRALAPASRTKASAIPLLHSRESIDGKATAYVCRQFTCRLPVTEAPSLREELASMH